MFGVFSEVFGDTLTKEKELKLIVLIPLRDKGTDQVKPSKGLCFCWLMTCWRRKRHFHYYSTIHVPARDRDVQAQSMDWLTDKKELTCQIKPFSFGLRFIVLWKSRPNKSYLGKLLFCHLFYVDVFFGLGKYMKSRK